MASTRGAGGKARLIATAALSMAAFGVVMTCLGASLQTVIARFGIDKAQAGALLSLLSFWILAGTFSTSAILAFIPAFVLMPLMLSAISTFPPEKQPHGFPVAQARRLLRDPVLLLMGVMLFLESGMESTVGGWVSILFAEELSVAAERAPMYLALFWLGLMVTRLVLGVLLQGMSGVRVLFASIGVALG